MNIRIYPVVHWRNSPCGRADPDADLYYATNVVDDVTCEWCTHRLKRSGSIPLSPLEERLAVLAQLRQRARVKRAVGRIQLAKRRTHYGPSPCNTFGRAGPETDDPALVTCSFCLRRIADPRLYTVR